MHRRVPLAVVPLLAVALSAGAAQARTPARPLARVGTIVDPRADWTVDGEDILKVTVRGVGKRLSVDLELAAPVPAEPSYYQVQMQVGCHLVVLAVNTVNGAVAQDPTLPSGVSVNSNFYSEYGCQPDATGSYQADDSADVVPTVHGTHLVWSARYLQGMQRGVVVTQLSAFSNRANLNPIVYIGRNGVGPTVGDDGSSATPFVLG